MGDSPSVKCTYVYSYCCADIDHCGATAAWRFFDLSFAGICSSISLLLLFAVIPPTYLSDSSPEFLVHTEAVHVTPEKEDHQKRAWG